LRDKQGSRIGYTIEESNEKDMKKQAKVRKKVQKEESANVAITENGKMHL
jgi:hypothetical protein